MATLAATANVLIFTSSKLLDTIKPSRIYRGCSNFLTEQPNATSKKFTYRGNSYIGQPAQVKVAKQGLVYRGARHSG